MPETGNFFRKHQLIKNLLAKNVCQLFGTVSTFIILHRTALDRGWFFISHVQGSSPHISAERNAILCHIECSSVRIEIGVSINSVEGWPKFEFDSAHEKYGV